MTDLKTSEKCPTEEICLSDKINGECGRTGRTLEQHCHSDVESGGCRLYWTKAGTTPPEFAGFMEAVTVCRARHKAGLKQLSLPYWAEKAYLVGTAVYALIEAEQNEKAGEPDSEATDFSIKGKGDSSAFSLIAEHIQSQNVQVKRVYGRQHDSSG